MGYMITVMLSCHITIPGSSPRRYTPVFLRSVVSLLLKYVVAYGILFLYLWKNETAMAMTY